MNTKKLHKKIDELLNLKYFQGWEDGYQVGLEEVDPDATGDEEHDAGVNEGVAMERKRTQDILEMHIKWAMESGKGNDAIKFKQIKEILIPIVVDYSEEAYQKDLEKDGF